MSGPAEKKILRTAIYFFLVSMLLFWAGCNHGEISVPLENQFFQVRPDISCSVEPNPVYLGSPLVILGQYLPKKSLLRVSIQDGSGSQVLEVNTDRKGTLRLEYESHVLGPGNVEIYRISRKRDIVLTGCEFEVVQPDICPNQICEPSEDCSICPEDCGPCSPTCGDASCDPSEDCSTCPEDCGACLPICGDLSCDAGEDCASCPEDCGECDGVCGDQVCSPKLAELCTTCQEDCSTREVVCGNGECQDNETSQTCYADCGPSPWPSENAQFEAEVLRLINEARFSDSVQCLSGKTAPFTELTNHSVLEAASRLHAWDLNYSGYFSHTSCNGRSMADRVRAQGNLGGGSYWMAETLAMGSTPLGIVNAWLNSYAGHCEVLLGERYNQIGVGCSDNICAALFIGPWQ